LKYVAAEVTAFNAIFSIASLGTLRAKIQGFFVALRMTTFA